MLSVSSPQPQDEPPESSNSQWASWLLIGIALAAVIALAIVNTTSKESQSASSATEGDTHTIDVKVDGMAFVPNHVDVDPGTHLVVNFTNTGDQVHDLKIGDAETGRVDPGDTVQLDAGVIESSIEGYCTIAGHRLQGMTFNVNVGESAPRTGGLWEESSEEIIEGMRSEGMPVELQQGPWGQEIVGTGTNGVIRIIGVEGPRWLYRVTLAAPTGSEDALAEIGRETIARSFV